MKKLATLVLSLMLIISFTACSEGDMTKDKSAEEILEGAMTKATEWENYEMDIDSRMVMNIPIQGEMEMNINGHGVAFIKPLKMHMTMTVEMEQLPEPQSIEQYLIQEGDTLTIYQQLEGQWYKQVMEGSGMEQLASVDPIESIQLFMKHLKGAEIVEEGQINEKDAVKIDATVSFDMYKELIAGNQSLDMSLGLGTNVFDMLGEMGDLTYSIWVEKETLNVTRYEMDLTEAMNKMAEAMEGIEELPQEAVDAYKNSKMEMTITITNHNQAADFEIPEEALNAEEIPMN